MNIIVADYNLIKVIFDGIVCFNNSGFSRINATYLTESAEKITTWKTKILEAVI